MRPDLQSWLPGAVGLLLASMPHFCVAQDDSGSLDNGLLNQRVFNINCDFSLPRTAQDCVGKILPTLRYKSASYIAAKASYVVKVTYKEFPDQNNNGQPMASRGTGFLIDVNKRYLLTSKHVLMGQKVWSTTLKIANYPDFESAVEAYLSSDKVTIQVSTPEDAPTLTATLVALDRGSDLALLAVNSLNAFQVTNFGSLFKPITTAVPPNCDNAFSVTAIGFVDGANPGVISQRFSNFADATCDIAFKDYHIGGQQYRVLLYSTASPFLPGFSGGPVLDRNMQLIGVVSGATVQLGGANTSFFVPITQVRAFLARF